MSTHELDERLCAIKALRHQIRRAVTVGACTAAAEATLQSALSALRQAHGIETLGQLNTVTCRVCRERLQQGYTLLEVSWMTGLARSTVGNVKGGWRGPRGLKTADRDMARPQAATGMGLHTLR